jgi:ABC-2 type transport system ATP-binding protein
MSEVAAIEVTELVKRYPRVTALGGVSLRVEQGEFFGLLGPNGAGKTTLISIVAGLARATSGRATVLGHDVVDHYRAARRCIGVVPQELVFDPFFSVRESLRFQSGYFGLKHNEAWIDELLQNLGLSDKADANMRRLSGGMKRRALVAQALVHKPPVIVLDEPTAGVDVELRQSLWAFIQRLNQDGHTILLTTHYLEEAEALCNRVAMLKDGRVIALDHTANLLRSEAERRLELRLAPMLLPQSLKGLVIEATSDRYVLALPDYERLEGILETLRVAGVKVEEMQLQQAGLEEVFLRIMAAGGRP